MAQFQGIPAIPLEKMPQWQYDLLLAVKEDLEILMGQRGPGRAVTNDTIGVIPEERQLMKQLESRGDYYALTVGPDTLTFPKLEDYVKLLNNVQQLAIDVAKIEYAFNQLLSNMGR